MLKTVARNLSRNIWFWRRLPRRFGGGRARVLVSPSSHLAYWAKSVDAVHGALLRAIEAIVRPGDCVWDVGANVGVVSVGAASLAGRDGTVVSVEADASLVGKLRRTARGGLPAGATMEVLPAAVCDRVGIARFNISSFASATNALDGFGRFAGVARVESVCAVTLDWLADHVRAPDVIKIDVEGAEVLVLQGGRGLLTSRRPLLLVEVGDEVAAAMAALLDELDYVPYGMSALDAGDAGASRTPLTHVRGDVFATPRERPPPWSTRPAVADAAAPLVGVGST